MASGPIVGGNDGANREKQRYSENKVYTRKAFKGPKNQNKNTATTNAAAAAAAAAAANNLSVNTTTGTTTATADVSANDINKNENNGIENTKNENNGIENNKGEDINDKSPIREQSTPTLTLVDTNSDKQPARLDAVSDDSSSLNRQQASADPPTREVPSENGTAATTREAPSGNGTAASMREAPSGNGEVVVKPGLENRVKINLGSRSKQEMREIKKKLESELDLVRSLVKRIEVKEGQIGGVSNSRVLPLPLSDGIDNGVKRVHSEVASVSVPITRVGFSRQSRPLNQLSISTVENSQGVNENMEKEKRTPKANQFYRNSEFLLAKDKFPPAESNKKSKMNGKKQGVGELGHGFGTGSKFFRSCSALLEKLMKHKHGWVFNAPVDVKGLGLHDYFTIIKHPMDLGTVKSRLTKNWYKSPKEFAEDVRLTFHNAMTYNPKGQDVHVMAEQLLKIFEDKWAVIESDYNRDMRIGADYDMGFHTPTSRKALPLPPPLDMRRILDRSESMTHPMDPRLKPVSTTPSGRTPAPKKPKAKDPHKRDMTYEEKQKLSTNLQSLPSEKLDNIVQIIKKRNSSLFQHDDEIEVDIDSVDAETLWELDRFVTNYKKSLSKNKRKAELAIQARAEAEQNLQQQAPAPVVQGVPKETRTDEKNATSSSPVQADKHGDNGSRSSSSSSSSSDSGSSSSDSDSETSSSGSDGGNSPRT
ncbi:transcription factor GTE4 [Melia azedarach]|uniref:Transcription factor GTE4 n=1 Tax=Melia azedarach TaxID=155640 RepID=A0ACC1Z352_MELAZ|nr:transcription factor GTE4 [Melia azedarach]